MSYNDIEACMQAFNGLCDEANESDLIDAEDCQFWVFERGYQAAIIDIISALNASILPKIPLDNNMKALPATFVSALVAQAVEKSNIIKH